MENELKWRWTDGWILMSTFLTHRSEGVRLHEVIAVADGINHAIPTAKELSRSFTKLVRSEVIQITEGRFQIREEHLPEIEKAYQRRGGLFESATKGEKWLRSLHLTSSSKHKVVISEEEVSIAYEEYIAATRKR